jgi:hypothetical protein
MNSCEYSPACVTLHRIQDERNKGFIELRPGCTTRPDTEVFRHSVHPDTVQAGEELVSGSSLKKNHIKKIDPGANPKKLFYGRNLRTVNKLEYLSLAAAGLSSLV